jgi:hypothetical protein
MTIDLCPLSYQRAALIEIGAVSGVVASAIRHLFDGLVTGQMVPDKLAASVRRPCHVAPPKVRFAVDSPLEQRRFELVWGFSCQAVVLGCADSFCSERERPFFGSLIAPQVSRRLSTPA